MITIAQIIVSVLLIALILLQERASGLSGLFGGGGEYYQTRRGIERFVFAGTIAMAIIFAALTFVNLVI